MHATAGMPPIANHLLNRPTIVRYLRDAKACKGSLEPNHSQRRENYLVKLAEAKVLQRALYLKAPEFSQELQYRQDKEIKQLIYREQKKYQYKKIGWILGVTQQYDRLKRVEIPA